jgi:hypothetical protein
LIIGPVLILAIVVGIVVAVVIALGSRGNDDADR